MVPPHSSQPPPTPSARTSNDAPSLLHPAELRFRTDRLPWQRSLRWDRPVRDRRLLLFGAVLALAITLLELVGFGLGMKPYRHLPKRDSAIHVVLIEPEPPPPPPPPEPEPPEIVRRASRIAIEPPKVRTTPPPPRPAEQSEANARIGSSGVAAPQLFNPDGSVRLGDGGAVVAPPSRPENPREAAKARWAEIEKRGNPLDCKKTRFANAFRKDESVGDQVAGKYLKWIGLADPEAIAHRRQQRAASGGCDPAQ